MVYALNVPEKFYLVPLLLHSIFPNITSYNTLIYKYTASNPDIEQGDSKHRRKAYHSQRDVPRVSIGVSLINE